MESNDTPGSPRKKPKLEESASINSTLNLSGATENMDGEEGNNTAMPAKMNNVVQTNEQQILFETSKDAYLPTTNASAISAGAMKMGASAIDSPLDQFSKERVCGIKEFVSSHVPGFSGVLKKRYTDFMVNEILLSGEVVHLTSLRPPKKEKPREEAMEQLAIVSQGKEQASKSAQLPQEASRQVTKDTETVFKLSTAQSAPSVAAEEDERGEIKQEEARLKKSKQEETKHEETPLPHERIVLPHLATEPKLGTSPKPSPAKETRIRQQSYLRHNGHGWAEFDKLEADNDKEIKAGVKLTAIAATNEEPASTTPKRANILLQEEHAAAAGIEEPRMDNSSNASPQAKWQAYADPNGESSAAHKISDEDRDVLLSYFSEPVVDGIRSLYNRILNSARRATRDYGTVKSAVIDRQLRAKIHQDIRRIFQSRLETMTDNDGAIIVSAMPPSTKTYNDESGENANRGKYQRSKGHFGNSRKPNWQELGGDFLHFTLYKENKDTMECISWLSKVLKLGPRAFEFAGTKDRRAVTVQRVSVYRQFIGRIIDAGKSLRQARIGDFEYRPQALQLGELAGNEFTITLRDCTFGDSKSIVISVGEMNSIVSNAFRNLVERGFINYFGLQRFGTFSTSTDDVGVKLLQGNFKGAVEAILYYNPESLAISDNLMLADDRMSRDDKARLHAIHVFRTTGKAQRALADLPRKFSAESAIIRYLGNKPNQAQDYLGAIRSIQRNLRLMYVHAYQSLVWNMAASKRWSLYGDTVAEGDLVLVNEHTDTEEPHTKIEEVDEDGEVIVKPADEDRATNVEDLFTRARALSKEEAESGNYTIFDIVLPTPGFDVLYPANEMVKFYEDFMASPRGGGLDAHNMRRPQKDFSLSGSYRKILAKPGKESSFEIKMYENDDEQFVKTDMDRLNEAHDASNPFCQEIAKQDSNSTPSLAGREQVEKETDGDDLGREDTKLDSDEDIDSNGGVSLQKIAVVLKIQLGASQYATMALRELMKAGGVKTYKADFGGGR